MSATLVCRHPAAALLGVSGDGERSEAMVTLRGDGVVCYHISTQKRTYSRTLGPGQLELQSAASLDPAGKACIAALYDRAAAQPFLVRWVAHDNATTPLGDLAPRLVLKAPVSSVHTLAGAPSTQATAVAVLTDGKLAWFAEGALSASYLQRPDGAKGAPAAAAATRSQLVLAHQAGLEVYGLSGSALALVRQIPIAAPGSGAASISSISVAGSSVALLWSDGCLTVAHNALLSEGEAANGSYQPTSFRPPEALIGSAAAAATAEPASSRKRKAPPTTAAAAQLADPLLLAAVDDSRLAIMCLRAAGTSTGRELAYVVLESRFGCTLAQGAVPLEAEGAANLGTLAGACSVSALHADAGRFLLHAAGTVFLLELPMPPTSLLSLVGRLALASDAPPPARALGGSDPAAPPLGSDAHPGIVEQVLQAHAPVASATAAAGLPTTGNDPAYVLQLVPASAQVQQPSNKGGKQDERALLEALAAPADAPPPSAAVLKAAVEAITQCCAKGQSPSSELVALTCTRLAAAGSWQQLSQLVKALPLNSMARCPHLLTAVAEAQQYQLLAPLCCRLQEVPGEQLVAALRCLLAPTSAANLPARKAHHGQLAAHAEAAVKAAEAPQRGARGQPPPSPQQQAALLALAKCAAAAVDGFSYQGLLLHPLLAMHCDMLAVQAALRQLSNAQVDGLLGYLMTWVAKYTQQLGDAVAEVALPEELVFPTFPQVLQWVQATVDAHLARLVMQRGGGHVGLLRKLQQAVQAHVEASQRLLALRGVAEHMRSAAPLPEAQAQASSKYFVRVLDLGVTE